MKGPRAIATAIVATGLVLATGFVPASSLAQSNHTPELLISPRSRPPQSKPWRMYEVLESPPWLVFGGEQRTRYEKIFNQFRPNRPGDDGLVAMRTHLSAELRFKPVKFKIEVVDARAYLSDDNTPLSPSIVNPLELLQAHAQIELHNVVIPNADAYLRLGRLTLDIGSRRLIARNRYRNTINGFTGVELDWTSEAGLRLRTIFALPVQRLPDDPAGLRNNSIRYDKESIDVALWTLFIGSPPFLSDIVFEAFVIGLHERDGPNRPTRNRILVTPGFRVFREARPGGIDFQIESVAQVGTSRRTADAEDRIDLQHRAFFQHASVGYTLAAFFRPRASLFYDFASGDQDPNDDVNGRFDTLFGARRFEFGPSGIYGAFARSNIHSPGARLEIKPLRNLRVFGAYRAFWLATSADAWTTTGLADASGESGSFLGHQIEARIRFDVFVSNLRLETGIAHLFRGRFVKEVSSDSDRDERADPTLVYTNWVVTF